MATAIWPEGWPQPNYVDPQKRGSPILFILTCLITAVVVALRLYSRCRVTRSLGVDDYLLTAGFVLSIGQTFAAYKALSTWGWNLHIWDVPPDRLLYVRLSAWLNELFFLLGNACTKISILLVYRKITAGTHNIWFIRLTWAAIAFTVAYTIGLLLELSFICRPLNSYWESYSPGYTGKYTCHNEQFPVVFSAALSVFSDVYASVLPMLLIRKLNLTSRQRFGLYVLFSAGLLTAAIGIVRMMYLIKVTTNYMLGPHTSDSTWNGWPTYALADIEPHLAIICASAPALKVLFQRKIVTKIYHTHPSSGSVPSKRAPSSASYRQSLQAEHRGKPSSYLTALPTPSKDDTFAQSESVSSDGHEDGDENISLHRMASNKLTFVSSNHIASLAKNDWQRLV